MTEKKTKGYKYVVLAETSHPEATGRSFAEMDTVTAANPEAAIEIAVTERGLPNPEAGRCIAVAASNWHERDVAVVEVPEVRVTTPPSEAPETPSA